MRRRDVVMCVSVAVSLAIGAATTGQLHAAGYWNMPGTLSQRMGHGYSGGYHAPFLLGPIRLDGWGAPNEVRLPCSPSPFGPCACFNQCGQAFEATSAMQGAVPVESLPTAPQPAPAPEVAPPAESSSDSVSPSAELTRPLFAPPVQR
jgi:hypothetical protein